MRLDSQVIAMMTTNRGPLGPGTFSLKPAGWSRYIEVAFLGIWLTGWLVGEVVMTIVFGGMLAGTIAAAFGITLSFASRLTPDGSAPFLVLFMVVWLTIWTIGGIAAGTQFLRMLAGRDVVSVSPDGLEIEWRLGPFRRRRTIAHGAIKRLRLGPRNSPVVADTKSGTVEITDLGTLDERTALIAWLQQRLALPGEAEAKRLDAEAPPPEWEVEVDGMETRLSRPLRHYRRVQAAILWTITALLFTGCLPLFQRFQSGLFEGPRPGAARVVYAAGVVSLLFAWWSAWTTWGRSEWVVVPGRLTWRRQFASWRRERSFENARLVVEHTVDSDNDDRYTLRVRGENASRKISTALYDDADLTGLAQWLSARTRFPID
jgi:hypothetical protein